MAVPSGHDCSGYVADAGVAGVLSRELAVPRIPLMWRTHVCGDGTAIQGGVSRQGALYRNCHCRAGYNTLGVSVRDVVFACCSFSGCRDYHAQIPEVVILGGDGGIHLCVCRGVDCPDIKIPVLLSHAGRDEQNYYVTLTVMLQR